MKMNSLIEEALDGIITCRKCGCSLEPDCEKCGECGWKNPLIEMGFI